MPQFFVSILFFSIVLLSSVVHSQVAIRNSSAEVIQSEVLGRAYTVQVKLPKSYDSDQSKTYPVLYVQDAPYAFGVAASATHFSPLDDTIIVGIGFAVGEHGQFSRVRDLTPELDSSWETYETGGARKYFDFLSRELVPHIEDKYRIKSGHRIFAGHSLGGSFGAWLLLTQPEFFSGYILTSPSLWFKEGVIFDYEESYHELNDDLNAKVYIATGSYEIEEFGMYYDMVGDHVRFVELLKSRDYGGLQLKDEVVQGTDHYTTFPVGLAKGLNWLLVER